MPKFEPNEKTPLLGHDQNNDSSVSLLLKFPTEIWISILLKLNNNQLGLLSQTSRWMWELAGGNILWKIKAQNELPSLFLTDVEVINHTNIDEVPGLRKKYYRNTLFANKILSLDQPAAPREIHTVSDPCELQNGWLALLAIPVIALLSVGAVYCCCCMASSAVPGGCKVCLASSFVRSTFEITAISSGGLGCLVGSGSQAYCIYEYNCGTWGIERRQFEQAQALHTQTVTKRETEFLSFFYPPSLPDDQVIKQLKKPGKK